jgi:uncharacterized membrane protein
MKRLQRFISTTLLGGVIVILPVLLTFLFLRWVYRLLTDLISPITQMMVEKSGMHMYFAILLAAAVIVLICFLIGLFMKTRVGSFIHDTIENGILKIAPGYSLFKETIKHLIGQDRKPFSRVALVQIFENSTLATGFVTDQHQDGYCTVYVPSGLNPTTGLIYHIHRKYVHMVDVSVEDTMRSIISCGAGSKLLVEKLLHETENPPPLFGHTDKEIQQKSE